MAVYGYARVSTAAQAESSESLGTQQRTLEGYAMMHGLKRARRAREGDGVMTDYEFTRLDCRATLDSANELARNAAKEKGAAFWVASAHLASTACCRCCAPVSDVRARRAQPARDGVPDLHTPGASAMAW
jgi:hypothetical protein